MKKTFKFKIIFAIFALITSFAFAKKPYNILFIAVDDLRPDLNCYGNSQIISPNIDKFASTARLFLNHQVQVPTCGASRYAMLTGIRPKTQLHLSNAAGHKLVAPKKENKIPESFPHNFRRNGYKTISISKISHYPNGMIDKLASKPEYPYSWDERYFEMGIWSECDCAFRGYQQYSGNKLAKLKQRPLPFEIGDDNIPYPDELNASLAIKKLQELSKEDKPFLLAVGFIRPHLPFNSPKKFWDLYDESKIPLAKTKTYPINLDHRFYRESGEFNSYLKTTNFKTQIDKAIDDNFARKLKHGYYSAITYTDSQVGRVLDELERLNLDDNTIVVLWGDHGWQLGEKAMWGKHNLFKLSTNSPLIIRVPNMKNAGQSTQSLAESVDLYPTLAELCNIKVPESVQGKSLVKIIENPNNEVKSEIYSYWNNSSISLKNKDYSLMLSFGKHNSNPRMLLFDNKKDIEQLNDLSHDPAYRDIINKLMKKAKTHVDKYDITYLKDKKFY